jgi:hypothetical protein
VTRREGAPFFSTPQKIGQVLVDSGGAGGLQRLEEVSDYPTHPSGPRTPQKLTALHMGYKQCGYYDNHYSMRGVGYQLKDPVPSLCH